MCAVGMNLGSNSWSHKPLSRLEESGFEDHRARSCEQHKATILINVSNAFSLVEIPGFLGLLSTYSALILVGSAGS